MCLRLPRLPGHLRRFVLPRGIGTRLHDVRDAVAEPATDVLQARLASVVLGDVVGQRRDGLVLVAVLLELSDPRRRAGGSRRGPRCPSKLVPMHVNRVPERLVEPGPRPHAQGVSGLHRNLAPVIDEPVISEHAHSRLDGSLSFGLVNIPVRLIDATEPKDVRFPLRPLRSACAVRARRGRRRKRSSLDADRRTRRPRPRDARPRGEAPETRPRLPSAPASEPASRSVGMGRRRARPRERVRRGRDRLARGGARAGPAEQSRTIDVEDFVELADIDPVSFEKTYYVVPADRDAKPPYLLLHRAMQQAGRIGSAASCSARSRTWSRSGRCSRGWPSRRCSSATRSATRLVRALDLRRRGRRAPARARDAADRHAEDRVEPAGATRTRTARTCCDPVREVADRRPGLSRRPDAGGPSGSRSLMAPCGRAWSRPRPSRSEPVRGRRRPAERSVPAAPEVLSWTDGERTPLDGRRRR